MKVFISSLIGGYGAFRQAVADGAETLRCDVLRAEDFGARPETPQQACLTAVREADVVVLLLGSQYGAEQPSGRSATYEEWQEAVREQRPVLVFIETLAEREPAQEAFIADVEAWAAGRFRESFSTPEELTRKVIRGLHDLSIAGPADETEMRARAEAAMPQPREGFGVSSSTLVVAVAAGPRRQVLRPAEIENRSLIRRIQQEAMFGDDAPLSANAATEPRVAGSRLRIAQAEAEVTVDEDGTVTIVQPAIGIRHRDRSTLPSIVEEDLQDALTHALRFVSWVLEQIDPLHRVTDIVAVAAVQGAASTPWRTRAEIAASPNSGSFSVNPTPSTPVAPNPALRRRSSLAHDAQRIAEDLVVLLRRVHR